MIPIKREISSRYVIQNRKAGTYLKHDGTESNDHPYDDVEDIERSTVWLTLAHAIYVLWWYVEIVGDYRIISLNSGVQYIRDKSKGIGHVIEEPEE